jgi:hypothetical protein
MTKLTKMNAMWRASFFRTATDTAPESCFIIAARSEDEAAQIAFARMMDIERVDLVRTLDTSAIVPMGEMHLL